MGAVFTDKKTIAQSGYACDFGTYWDSNIRKSQPIFTVEKDNVKFIQYELIGLNSSHVNAETKFDNKTKIMYFTVKGEYKDQLTEWDNDIDVEIIVDYKIYDKINWFIKDGILTVMLYEILNEIPELEIEEII